MKRDTSLNQYFTPQWAAELIVKHYYPNLGRNDVVFDIGSGDGRFLRALPDEVTAYGFEVDEALAKVAQSTSGREVIVGDVRHAPFPANPTLIIGNPPFELSLVEDVLTRGYECLDYNQEAGFVLPVYFFQTADTLLKFHEKWTIRHDLMPRNMFQNMQKPIMFARFIKERKTTLVGFYLYQETADMLSLRKQFKTLFLGNESSSNVWGEAIDLALLELGGKATLKDIYRAIEGKRPTKTQFWKEAIRKHLQKYYQKLGPALYGLESNLIESSEPQLAMSF